jgi:hypothetical protein
LTWTLDEIFAEVKKLEEEQKQIKHNLLQLCWYMRGGITYEEVFFMSPDEREIIGTIVKANLETTKKSGLPFF